MIIALKDIIEFRNMDEIFGTQKIPVRVAYALSKIKEAAQKEWEFYSAQARELIDECSEHDETGGLKFDENGNFILLEDKKEEFYNRLSEIENVETQVACDPIPLSSLENLEIDLATMEKIMPILDI